MPPIDTAKVLQVVRERTAPPEASPEQPAAPTDQIITGMPKGGWGPEAPDERSHFMAVTGTTDKPGEVVVRSLCNAFEGEAMETELDLVDPLAPENCIDCHVQLLKRLQLI
jgi:hypothetical protein